MKNLMRKIHVNRKLMNTGLVLILLGLLLPAFLTVQSFFIFQTIHRAIAEWEKIYVLEAAIKLVALNTLRSFPCYLGAFFVAQSLEAEKPIPKGLVHAVSIIILIPSTYQLIDFFYGIHYDFGVPANLMIAMLIILGKINFTFVNLMKKSLMVAMLVISFQFLDVMPRLPSSIFGRGEISNEIKMIAQLLHADPFLQEVCVLLLLLSIFITVLLIKLISDENNLQLANEEREKKEQELMETQMRVLENRTYMEVKHLVHDLKSPLTSIQALVGVVRLSLQQDGRTMEDGYLKRIENSIEQMSGMITEILDANHRTTLAVREIVKSLLAQISITEYSHMVTVDCNCPDLMIEVNEIRFLRALINLIENSFYAVDKASGKICLTIQELKEQDSFVAKFTVSDNGTGISPELLPKILERGVTSHQSSGLGLSFVHEVVVENDGTINLLNYPGDGFTVEIRIPAFKN